MTNKEAIELFKDVEVLVFRDVKQKYFHEDIEDAFKMAIEALEVDVRCSRVETQELVVKGGINMQIVIDLDEEYIKQIDRIRFLIGGKEDRSLQINVINAIKNGTPLPKGHGRLIDADRLKSMHSINLANFNTVVGIQKWIDDAPTIIDADKSEREG